MVHLWTTIQGRRYDDGGKGRAGQVGMQPCRATEIRGRESPGFARHTTTRDEPTDRVAGPPSEPTAKRADNKKARSCRDWVDVSDRQKRRVDWESRRRQSRPGWGSGRYRLGAAEKGCSELLRGEAARTFFRRELQKVTRRCARVSSSKGAALACRRRHPATIFLLALWDATARRAEDDFDRPRRRGIAQSTDTRREGKSPP